MMRRQAVETLVEHMVQYRTIEPCDAAASIEDILQATCREECDGYQIARELELSFHWDCNLDIAEHLDEFSGILRNIYETAEQQWAAENPHDPAFDVGATVIWKAKSATIVGIYGHRPQCYKVRQGEMRPNSYYVVPFEDVS
jgi:hypothetical protein